MRSGGQGAAAITSDSDVTWGHGMNRAPSGFMMAMPTGWDCSRTMTPTAFCVLAWVR